MIHLSSSQVLCMLLLAPLCTMSNSSSTHHSQTRPEITGYPDDVEVASKSVSQDEKAVLHVIDASYDGTTPQLRRVFGLSDDIAEGMKSLSSHNNGTAWILDVTTHSDFIRCRYSF